MENIEPLETSATTSCIFVVDDSRVIRNFFASSLTECATEVHTFEDPVEAYEKAIEMNPSCILSDYEMPNLTGLELTKKLKTNPVTKDIPVIILSVHDQDEKIIECINAGAEDYLPKRTNPEVIISKVKLFLEVKKYRENRVNIERMRTYKATICTINHEINNISSIILPLLHETAGNDISKINLIKKHSGTLVKNLGRLVEVVHSLRDVDEVEFESYISDSSSEMVKLKAE